MSLFMLIKKEKATAWGPGCPQMGCQGPSNPLKSGAEPGVCVKAQSLDGGSVRRLSSSELLLQGNQAREGL